MKQNIYQKIYHTFQFLKVASICIGAFYLLFWFYRFFEAPFAQEIASFFEILIAPMRTIHETTQVYDGKVAEMGYFVLGIIHIIIASLMSLGEKITTELERRHELRDIIKKRDYEIEVNKELAKEHLQNLLKYKYFSIFIKYRINYLNEIVAQNKSLTIAEIVERSYNETATSIRKRLPSLGVRVHKTSIFIRGNGFENFEKTIKAVLDSIKETKNNNAKDAMKTDFSIIIDAQTDEEACNRSYKMLSEIAESDYYNKAIVTLAFKVRFELIQKESAYCIDALGYSVMEGNKSGDEAEYFLLRTKPKTV